MSNQQSVSIQADEQGNIVRVSSNNPEFGHVRLIQSKRLIRGGWVNKRQRRELLQSKLEEPLEQLEEEIIPWYSIRGIDPTRPIKDVEYASKRAILTNEFKVKEREANEETK